MTCCIAVVAYFYLPHGPAKPKSFFGKSFNIFTPREASVIVTRVIRNDPTKALRFGKPVLPAHILKTFMDWRLYGHLVGAFLSMVMIQPMNTYAPSIIKSLGFTGLQANGLNSVGSVCALVWSVSLAYSSDKLRERGFHITVGYLLGAAGLLWLALAPNGVGKWVLYGMCKFTSRPQSNTDIFRWRCYDSNGHGFGSSYQCSLAHLEDGRLQATNCAGCICDEYSTRWIPWQPAVPYAR